MTQTTDRLAAVLEKLTAIREVVREAHFALDDSEDQSHLDPPVYAVPRENADRLDATLTACEAFMPDDEAWNGPGPLVTQVMDNLQSLAKAEAEIERLREALLDARAFIDGDSPDWRYAKQDQLAAIDAALRNQEHLKND